MRRLDAASLSLRADFTASARIFSRGAQRYLLMSRSDLKLTAGRL